MSRGVTEAEIRAAANAMRHVKMPDGCTIDEWVVSIDKSECDEWGISWPTYAYDRARDVRDDQLEIFTKTLAKAALEAVAALAAEPGAAGEQTLPNNAVDVWFPDPIKANEVWQTIYDSLDLSEELRVECTDAVTKAISLEFSSPVRAAPHQSGESGNG